MPILKLIEMQNAISSKIQEYDRSIAYLTDMNINLTVSVRAAIYRLYDYEGRLADIEKNNTRLVKNYGSVLSNYSKLNERYNVLLKEIEDINATTEGHVIERIIIPKEVLENATNRTWVEEYIPQTLAFQYKYDCMQKLAQKIGPYVCLRAECELRYAGWWQDACDCWGIFSEADKRKC
jgi:hypothetical protein